ncbi:protein AUXIN RESPONSE 4 isoform X1 [Beta vulgaris subsp. vulgaris]|uniref:protein AUXIN RESPONSE 4 isoform X1 n=1 Tax=Beta vulgaris subsp. vulgaris TaxID=3555 RepID=UPI002036EE2D|nr:protein AUXIN RESPONSE 4 isoform X1 [Beta vulgaris subsp. vulgaris]
MAIITEHEDNQIDQPTSRSKLKPKPKPKSKPQSKPTKKPKSQPSRATTTHNPFIFWFYFTLIVSAITFFFVSLSSFSSPDPKTWFLRLPTILKDHYSKGRTIKVQINPNEPPIEVFAYSQGPKMSENVLIIHGLGCNSFTFRKVVDELATKGLFAVAIDLPGSGFSDKTVVREREVINEGGSLGSLIEVYKEIKEKGLFWGFDNLIEKGQLPYQEVRVRVSKKEVVEPLDLGAQEVGRVLGQVVDSMGLAPFHLVLHDSALLMGANWVVKNTGLLKSVTLIDTTPRGMALPIWALEVPVIRELVLRFDSVFGKLIDSCCSKGSSVEAHRVLLKGRDGRESIVGMGRQLNESFDLAEWASMDGIKGMPMQVLWSGSWSQEWNEEGKRVADVVSQAKFINHAGGRWPQDDTSSEMAENIISLISSLPKTERKDDHEPLPEHIQKMLDEAKAGGNHHHHGHDSHGHHDGHSHGDGAQAGYMDAYGLGHGHGWEM